MENFLASRPSIAKLSVAPKITANLFTSLANRNAPRSGPSPKLEHAVPQPGVEQVSHAHEPQVDLVRENGVVQRIVIVCQCGERIELDCAY